MDGSKTPSDDVTGSLIRKSAADSQPHARTTVSPFLSAFELTFNSGLAVGESLQNIGIATTAFNPLARPGELVLIVARGEGSGLAGKLANKLAVEHFTEAVLDISIADPDADTRHDEQAKDFGTVVHKPRAVTLLEAGFERANGQVYAFGHKLAAGGSLSTSIIAIAISDGELAAAKVGDGDVILERSGEKVWLFSAQEEPSATGMYSRATGTKFDSTVLVGSHRQVPVDFLHLAIEPHDSITVVSRGSAGPGGSQETRIETGWAISVGPQAVFLSCPA